MTLLLALFTLRQKKHASDPALLAYQQFCRKLARAGITRDPHEGARDYAERVARTRPDLAQASRDIVSAYFALRYKKLNKINNLHMLRQRVKAFSV